MDKTIAHTERLYQVPYENKEQIYLRCGAIAIIFMPNKILREFYYEDNLNNTYMSFQ